LTGHDGDDLQPAPGSGASRDPAEVGVTWVTPLILTTSSQNTAEVREMLAAAGSAEEIAGFTVGQPHEIPGLVAGHIEACADEVIFSFPSPAPRESPRWGRHSHWAGSSATAESRTGGALVPGD